MDSLWLYIVCIVHKVSMSDRLSTPERSLMAEEELDLDATQPLDLEPPPLTRHGANGTQSLDIETDASFVSVRLRRFKVYITVEFDGSLTVRAVRRRRRSPNDFLANLNFNA